jgi:bifunctional DNA-binding transcriptional regulator/antitoxin component of YhaV-PrlF toxin-antitoxin module
MDPAEVRNRHHWKAGDRVKVVDYGGVVSLIPVMDDPEAEAAGALKMRGKSLLQGLRRRGRSAGRRHY